MSVIRIMHFSDILCIWAYAGQIRIDELTSGFKDQVEVDFRLFSVFGNTQRKIEAQWGERGGMPAYSAHVRQVAAQFDHIDVHPDIWLKDTPASSLPAHLHLCAIRLAEQQGVTAPGSFVRMARVFRRAFFTDCADVSKSRALRELIAANDISVDLVTSRIESGAAYAQMSGDMQRSRDLAVRSSPTLIFNEDRQRLTGNVGYRIIEANIRELLEVPAKQHSWC